MRDNGRQRIFLIDLENYQRRLSEYIDRRPTDVIIYFCTQDYFKSRVKVQDSDAKYYMTGNNGENVSDYAMFFHLGYIVRTYCRSADYYIISNDNIFYNLVGVALDLDYNVILCRHVNGAIFDLGYMGAFTVQFTADERRVLGSAKSTDELNNLCWDLDIKQSTLRYMTDLVMNRRIL